MGGMSPAHDSKQWRQACREAGVPESERERASNDFHAEKKASGDRRHWPYRKLIIWLRDWMNAVIPDISPATVLARFRGQVTGGRLTHSKRIYLEVDDANGGRWRLISWEADYTATFAGFPSAKRVTSADLDHDSGTLTVTFSDRASLTLAAIPDDADDAIENWELFTPEGMVLAYGPWGTWRFGGKDDPDYWALPIARP
jgi:hypothetical protein